ncbi:MAG: GntG family PLP-dependent aldolase [Nitrolancea sp.]
MSNIIDLRGDWAAPPTPAMRQAMAEAEVGDDNSHEDPTVLQLEEMSAEMLGKEAAIFVPSGTMGNLVSILSLAEHGTEVIAGDKAHSVVYERGGMAAVGGHPIRTVPNTRFGMLDPIQVAAAVRPENIHFPKTGLLLLENTHNLCGGTVLLPGQMRELADVAHGHGFPVHLDGSRIFNASAALGMPVSELVKDVDTVTFCLSKGLAAPVGSMIAGTTETIAIARQQRKLLGGGMRQAGVIAAAGVVALKEMVSRLPEDNARARRLAEGLAELPYISIDLETVQSNIVFFDVKPPLLGEQVADRLRDSGVRLTAFGGPTLRFVTHYAISDEDVERVLHVMQGIPT